jgi:cell division protein FtsI/penicillin-binding protein 2
MYNVVNAPQGSGRSGVSKKLTIYGKTGTAEVDIRGERIKNTWFTSFVTVNDKRYVVTVLVEEGRSGGRDCAPVAKEFYERYFTELP